jgi:SNF2 family DNA or RNA helicase
MIVHTPSKSLLLKVRPKVLATLREIFPSHSKLINHEGHNIALPHNLSVVKVLRNMNIKAPSPIRYYYDWPRPARFAKVFEHQYATADFLTMNPRCFVLNEQGTSKTASAIWACDYLMKLGRIKRVLIAAKLSTLEQVWLNEIFDVAMHRTALVLHADADKRRELLAREVDFYIVNHDGLKILANDVRARKDIDLIIVDEASAFRNGTTEMYKTLEKTAKGKKLWLLTGTPCPNAPTDAWALSRLIDPTRVPPYFTQFKRATMNQLSTYKWAPKPGSHEMAFNAMQPAIRYKKSECLELPPVTYTTRTCPITKEQADAYLAMKNHMVADAKQQQITAANAADKISKLRQILCGAIKDTDTGEYITLDHAPRLKVLLEVIEEASAKVLVIVPFKGIVATLRDEMQEWHDKRGDGRRVEVVNGDVTQTKRNRIFQDFRDDANLTELVCHPKVMAHGLNLTQADVVVFYAPIYSNEESLQVMDRINRPGQTRKMTIVRIMANQLEKDVYAMVEGRAITQETILGLYKKQLDLFTS